MKALLLPLFIVLCLVVEVAFFVGQEQGRDACEERHQCQRGETNPCAFGPGVVGVQKCFGQQWDKCEPDPRFRVPTEGSAK